MAAILIIKTNKTTTNTTANNFTTITNVNTNTAVASATI